MATVQAPGTPAVPPQPTATAADNQTAAAAPAAGGCCGYSWSTVAAAVTVVVAAPLAYLTYTAGSATAALSQLAGYAAPLTALASKGYAIALANPAYAAAAALALLAAAYFAYSKGYLESCTSMFTSSASAAPAAPAAGNANLQALQAAEGVARRDAEAARTIVENLRAAPAAESEAAVQRQGLDIDVAQGAYAAAVIKYNDAATALANAEAAAPAQV